jgi:peptide/nickel transport system substrate-binding protein
MGIRLAIPLVALGVVLSGCGSGGAPQSGSSEVGATNDINPKSRDEVRDGGNLRLAITSFPATFNNLHIDSNGDTSDVVSWTMPSAFDADAAGNLTVDHNYFTDIKLTGTDPQQVTYTINPKATWTDGTPITWKDLASQAEALSGRNKNFLINGGSGFDRVDTVTRGADDRQAVVTFKQHYAEWQGQYGILYPKAATADPQAFSDMYRNGMPVSAGPFVITGMDRTQNRITLGRNPTWWGDTPKLDTVTYSVLDYSARIQALQNNEIDSVGISGIDELSTASATPGITVRRAPGPSYSHFTFNGAPGSILADPALRRAVAEAIDRQAIANTTQHGVVDNPKPLNNHIFMAGQKGYQDNTGAIAYNPDEAAKELDTLGWKLNGDVREKDGRKLEIRDVMYQQDAWVQIAQVLQQNLAKVGIKLTIQTYPGNGLFTNVIDPGNFDIAQFTWGGSILPLGALRQIYYYDPDNLQGNKGRIGSPELNALIDRTLSELDPGQAIQLANQADQQIFGEVFSLPIVQSPGLVAQREAVANFGAFGLGSPDYTRVGFQK